MKILRTLCLIITVFLPNRIKIFVYRHFFKWKVSPDVRIGFTFIDVKNCNLNKNCVIKNLSVIRGLSLLELGENSRVGNLNWISTAKYHHPNSRLVLKEESAITNRHYFDCTSTIKIGKFTTVAGVRSTFMTHSIDVYKNKQSSMEIVIGDHSFVGTNTIMLGGSNVSDKVIIAAGSTVLKSSETTQCSIFAGVPIKKVKGLDESCVTYFSRKKGVVS